MSIDAIIDGVLDREGGEYTNDPSDSGGPTKWGITQAMLSKHLGRQASVLEVGALTREQARVIYLEMFVIAPGFDKIARMSMAIADELVDTGVNCGPAIAATMLQRCLNAFNLNGKKYRDIGVDGACGGRTLNALAAFLAWRGDEGEKVLLRGLNCLQGERYIADAEGRPKDELYVYGWLRSRVA